jgi:hypothetical protein
MLRCLQRGFLILGVLVAYFVYRAYVRLVERRDVTELSWSGASNELGAGKLIGFGLAGAAGDGEEAISLAAALQPAPLESAHVELAVTRGSS